MRNQDVYNHSPYRLFQRIKTTIACLSLESSEIQHVPHIAREATLVGMTQNINPTKSWVRLT